MTHDSAKAGWLDFSASVNPLGPPAFVADALARASYAAYADLDPGDGAEHLAADAGVGPESVLLTAGATEAVRLVVAAFAEKRHAVAVGPTDSPFARLALRADAELTSFVAEPPSFDPPWEEASGWLRDHPGVLFAADPNDVTGRALGGGGLRLLIRGRYPLGTRLAVDQSFAPFARPSVTAAECVDTGNTILIRSFGPLLAAPGIRLGYAIADPRTIAALRAQQDGWTVGAHALAVARVASWKLVDADRGQVLAWRSRMTAALVLLGLEPVPSETNMLLVRVGNSASALVDAMTKARIAVRSCANLELPEYVRFAVRPPGEQDRLLVALAEARKTVGW